MEHNLVLRTGQGQELGAETVHELETTSKGKRLSVRIEIYKTINNRNQIFV